MNLRGNRHETLDINLTPLIDVVFLLLIFFMVSTTFERDAELALELPEATADTKDRDPDAIEVAIDGQGRYFVNGRPLVNAQVATIRQALAGVVEAGTRPSLIISADVGTPHQAVIAVMDAARQVGLVNISFPVRANPSDTR